MTVPGRAVDAGAAPPAGDYGVKTTLTVPSVFFWNCS